MAERQGTPLATLLRRFLYDGAIEEQRRQDRDRAIHSQLADKLLSEGE